MVNIYLGKNSIYRRKERKYAKEDRKKYISCREARGIIKLILRDLKRGWTYDRSGKKIRMTKDLARRRLIFLISLSHFHGSPRKEKICIKKEVEKALKKLKK